MSALTIPRNNDDNDDDKDEGVEEGEEKVGEVGDVGGEEVREQDAHVHLFERITVKVFVSPPFASKSISISKPKPKSKSALSTAHVRPSKMQMWRYDDANSVLQRRDVDVLPHRDANARC